MRKHSIFLAIENLFLIFFDFYFLWLKMLVEKKGQLPPSYPQQSIPQTGFAPQPGFAPRPGYSDGYPQSNFISVYGDGMPPANQHVPISDQEPMVKGFEFNDMSIRRGFIRKVYAILSVCTKFNHQFIMDSLTHHIIILLGILHFRFYFSCNYWWPWDLYLCVLIMDLPSYLLNKLQSSWLLQWFYRFR